MLFNSIDFALFITLFFVLYWFVTNKSLKSQNVLIVFASYVFYGWWDWRFLFLILISTLVDYSVGLKLKNQNSPTKRRTLLWTSIFVNLGILGVFKYYNFFLDNFISSFSFFGFELKASSLNIILPVGISFYTFQTLSYTIDIYRQKLEPTNNFIAFAAFVSFFPQLVAGPIERATNLLPKFYKKRSFDYEKAVDGMRQILWGLFKKIVIADNCAEVVAQIFNNSADMNGSSLFLGALLFTFQIYGDFSGYSDIAIGTARLFGFSLMQNFRFPYFSRDMAEFWRRWHISLSSWFRDYLYIPLGGSRVGTWITIRNLLIVFIVSGFWHGANWTFVVWGALNAIYVIPLFLAKTNRKNLNIVAKGRLVPNIKEFSFISFTFLLTVFTWIFFRANDVSHAIHYIINIFSSSLFSRPNINTLILKEVLITLIFIGLLILIEWNGRESKHALETLSKKWNPAKRIVFYFGIICVIFIFGNWGELDFIYFQF